MRWGSKGGATRTSRGGPIRPRRLARLWIPVTSKRAGIRELDGIRGLAAVAIVVFHAQPDWLPLGWAAVDLFFGLSGFLITSIVLKHGQSPGFLRQFYLRRGLRIWPIYYLTLLGFIVFAHHLPRAMRLVGILVLPDLHAGPSALLVGRGSAVSWLPEPYLEPGHRGAVLPALAGARARLRGAPGAAPGDRLRGTLGHGSRPSAGPRRCSLRGWTALSSAACWRRSCILAFCTRPRAG